MKHIREVIDEIERENLVLRIQELNAKRTRLKYLAMGVAIGASLMGTIIILIEVIL